MNEFSEFHDVYIDQVDLKGAFMGNLPGDKPLLDELGINLEIIKQESRVVFQVLIRKPVTFNCKSSDAVGPLFFSFLYSLFLLINGKIHFGYIYFLSLISNIFIFLFLNMLGEKEIGLTESWSVMGYSQLPITIFAFINLFLTIWASPFLKIILGVVFSIWASYTGAIIFTKYLELEKLLFVVAYPLFLVYFCFALIAIF